LIKKGANTGSAMKKIIFASAISVFAFGWTFAPAAWGASNQAEKSASQRHVRQSQARKPQSAPIPQNSCDYDRAAGRCVIDLGYGRCIECNTGPLN
jgi:hypothetical protein